MLFKYFSTDNQRKEVLFLWIDIWFGLKVEGETWMRRRNAGGEKELLTHIYCNIFPPLLSPPLPPFLIDLPLLPHIYF